MAGLADMEELIGKVANADVANYLKEAFTCYGAGAYRACIVLTFAALFEDIRLKTYNVAKVSTAAKAVSKAVEALAAGQKPFENQLIEQLRSQDLISELQSQSLKQIVNHRNKAAHPSGHIASAEEARYVFREAIDKFLSQPVLSTSHAVDEIIGELGTSNYFPSRQLSEIAKIAVSALAPVHASAHRQLVERLVKELKNAATQENARLFLQGLLSASPSDWGGHIRTSLLEKKSSDVTYGKAIFTLLAIRADLYDGCSAPAKARIVKLLEDLVGETEASVSIKQIRHPLQLCASIINAKSEEMLKDFDKLMNLVLNKYWNNAATIGVVRKNSAILSNLVDIYIKKASSSIFDTSNKFAKLLPDIDESISKVISDQRAFEIVSGVVTAANYGAWSAQEVASAKFAAAPHLRKKAKAFAEDHVNPAAGSHGVTDASAVNDILLGYLADE